MSEPKLSEDYRTHTKWHDPESVIAEIELKRVMEQRDELLDFLKAFCELIGDGSAEDEPINEIALIRLAREAKKKIRAISQRGEIR